MITHDIANLLSASSGKAYAGIGSRETPSDIMEMMTLIGGALEKRGMTLRSGGADGADSAFADGVKSQDRQEIFVPWPGFNGVKNGKAMSNAQAIEAEKIASKHHPAWHDKRSDGTPVLSQGAKKLHMPNCAQVLGDDLKSPSVFVMAWAKVDRNGNVMGGTGQAVRLAKEHGIPILNLIDPATRNAVARELATDEPQLEKFITQNPEPASAAMTSNLLAKLHANRNARGR